MDAYTYIPTYENEEDNVADEEESECITFIRILAFTINVAVVVFILMRCN